MKRRKLMAIIGAVAALVLTIGGVVTAVAATRDGGASSTKFAAQGTQQGAKDDHPWLGIAVANTVDGVLVTGVVPDSPAAKGGVKRGDLITQVNGNAVANLRELRERLQGAQVGQSLTLALKRDGTTTTVTVTPSQRPRPLKGAIGIRIGAFVEEQDGKVAVIGILPEGPAHKAGMQRNDVILAVGDKAVATVEQLREALGGAQPGSTINIKVRRGTQEPTLQVSIPERQPKPRHFGILPRFPRGLVPELEGLGPREMLDHLQKLQFQLTDKDNKPLTIDVVVGKLQSISGGTGAAVAVEGKGSFSLASDAVLIRQGQKVEASAFQAGDPVSVMTVNGQARLVVSPPHLGGHAAAPRKGPFHMMGKDGGAGPRFGPGPRLMPQ